MKKSLLALLITLCALFAAPTFSVRADGALQLSVANGGGDYETVESALAAAEQMAAKGELSDEGVRLVLTGTHTATVKSGVLFGQKTIFLPSGEKLPVTITGGTLNLPAGDVACANDYTFTNLTIPFDDTPTRFFAGSGNVTLEKITLNTDSDAEYKSRFFGDTCTAAVFDGWTEKNLEYCLEDGLFVSSVTLGSGFVYEDPNGYPYAAVGSSTDFSAVVGSRALSAKDTCPKLIVDGAALYNTMARVGSNPAGNSVLWIKSGTVNHLYGAGFELLTEAEGNITVRADGGTFKSFVRILSGLTLNGDLSVTLKGVDLSANTEMQDGRMIQTLFGSYAVNGNITVQMENVKADRYYGGMGSTTDTVTGDVSVTAKNCEFSNFFYGGAGKAKIHGNVENTLENVSAGSFRGTDNCAALGNAKAYTGKKDSVGKATNTLKNCSFTGTYCGGGSSGTANEIVNDLTGVTFYDYAYLAGTGNTVNGQIENRLTDCVTTKYYTFGGTNGGKIINSNLEYGVKNYISGGSFHGFWGGSASKSAVHRGNIYTEVSSGDFYGYDSSRPNSFSGGCRNAKHEGNAVTLIRGGTFHEYVVGGSIPNSEAYQQNHEGSVTLTLAGGTFKNEILANCLWGSYPEAVLKLDTTCALEPFSFALPMECDALIAGSPTVLTESVSCKTVTVRETGSLQLCEKVTCQAFTVEEGAPAPEIYGELICSTLDTGGKELILGAKSRIRTDAVDGGKISLHQTEFWLKQTYFTSPEDTEITLTQDASVLGEALVKQGTVEGRSAAFAGVGLLFSDRVSLRFAFDREWVEADRDGFSFTAKCGDRTVVNGASFKDLILKEGYYTVVSSPLNAAELGETVSCSGSLVSDHSFTLTELAENGVKIYGKEGVFRPLGNLLKAFANFAVAADNYKNGKSTPLPYETEVSDPDFASSDGFAPTTDSPMVTLTDKQLILDEGMRLRYYLRSGEMSVSAQSSSPVNDLYYFRNCQDVTALTSKKWIGTGFQKGYIQITVDLPVYPSQSGEVIRLMVSDKENLHLALPDTSSPYTSYVHEDYVDRPDAVAKTLSETPGSEELGAALLCYLQAGAEYYRTQPDLSDFSYPEAFSAGYAREDVSPHGFIVDLSSDKKSNAVLDPLYVTCLALWDGEELAFFFSVDVRQCPDYLTKNSKILLAKEFDIDPDKIYFNATHNHSSPNTTSENRTDLKKWYGEIFFPKMVQAAKKAVLDLAPATLYSGTAQSDPGTNYVRRYLRSDGTYTGIHNIVPSTNIVGYETEADKELRSLRFDRGDKKDILFVNWQGHAAHGAAYSYAATADFVGFLRDGVEKELDVHFIYCNGASGNLNFTPKLGEKHFTSPYFQGVGKSLVGTVKKAVAAETPIRSGKLKVTYIPHEAVIRHDDDATVAKANECYEAWQAYTKETGSTPPMSWFQENYGFQSRYEVSSIRARAGLGSTQLLSVWAFSFGDVGMAFAPYEMFDTNGMQIRQGSPFAVTMIGGYTNGTHSYIPSAYAAEHNGYEVYTCRYVFSTGDEVAAKLAKALTEMHD